MPYRAIGKDNLPGPVTTCPKQAAREFFAAYPSRKLCNVFAGHYVAGEFRPLHWQPGQPIPHWRNVARRTIERMGARNVPA